ncbi:hypothetical protein [Streptomyces acidiscabies]|uniref:hypothetical protein n=1 Tax=Streptomyces acidiscabies TaxID=42234 RepID=UPI0038F76621
MIYIPQDNPPQFLCIVHPDGNCPTDYAAYQAGLCFYEFADLVEALVDEVSDIAEWPTR